MSDSTITTARNDLKALVRDAQALFDEATAAGGAKAEELRSKGMKAQDQATLRVYVHEMQTSSTWMHGNKLKTNESMDDSQTTLEYKAHST